MTNMKLNVWGREFELPVEFDLYEGEDVSKTQKEALSEFEEKNSHEGEVVKNMLLESSLDKLKAFCLDRNKEEIQEESIDNIFKYVIPQNLYVLRSETCRVVALMCAYKFDLEHGLAIVFENECLKEIGTQDLVL